MTTTLPPLVEFDPDDEAQPREGSADPEGSAEPSGRDDGTDEPAVVRTSLVAVAAILSGLAGVWMVTRLFRGGLTPPLYGIAGLVLGVGPVILSYRMRRPAALQYLVLPAAVAVGAALATAGGGGEGSLPSLVADAIRSGGLSQPPILFEPGWRFLTVVLFALVGGAAAATAVSLARPKLAVAVPLPVTFGAALLQPEGSEVLASGVAIVLVVGGLAVAYGADLATKGVVGGGFEIRRLARGVVLLTGVVAALVGLAQTDLLFPATDQDEVIPPQRPPTPPPQPDRVLFTVTSDRPGPWRVGVLDVYDDDAFMLPSIDPSRLLDVPGSGVVDPGNARPTYEATFRVADVKGQTLPGPPNPVAIEDVDDDLEFDPRTQVFKLVDRSVPDGFRYTMVAAAPPSGRELAEAPAPDPAIVKMFAAAPPPPAEIAALLTSANVTNPFDRLQFVRQALYGNVVAAGAGRPVDIVPTKVVEMVQGGEATPYEIVAGEVLLARWAGVPARLGFGFFGGEAVEGDAGARAFRPKHGASFLEAYFEGYGWVPVVGTPPKAKASLSNEDRNEDPRVVPTEELALVVFVPVRSESIRLVYELVRYWATIVVPIAVGFLALVAGYPAALKAVRTSRRRRWALGRGAAARIAVAYANLRDHALDLNIGDPRATPLQFLAAVADDDEHAELAWLVTRALWGDLARDLRIEDVEAAEAMSRSVLRRVLQEQTAVNRLLAQVARASLRDPWSDQMPNLWRARRRLARRPRLRARLSATARVVRRHRGRIATSVIAALFLSGCGGPSAGAAVPPSFPDPLVPESVLGYAVAREKSVEKQYQAPGDRALVSDGRVFTIRGDDTVQGSFQVALFKPDVDGSDRDVQEGIERGLGGGAGFRSVRIGIIRLRTLELTEQRLFLWFPPGRNAMELWVMRKGFGDAEAVVRSMIAHQRGVDLGRPASSTTGAPE